MSPEDLSMLVRALAFAAGKHRDQRRKDLEASPYINHPIALTDVLVNEAGVTDAEVIAAALLHDTMEDTETTAEELDKAFGSRIRKIVEEVSDDQVLEKRERKRMQILHAPHLSNQARLVKLSDKICNLRDLIDCPPHGWSLQRRQGYFDWSKKVIDGLRGPYPKLEEIFDEAYKLRPE